MLLTKFVISSSSSLKKKQKTKSNKKKTILISRFCTNVTYKMFNSECFQCLLFCYISSLFLFFILTNTNLALAQIFEARKKVIASKLKLTTTQSQICILDLRNDLSF